MFIHMRIWEKAPLRAKHETSKNTVKVYKIGIEMSIHDLEWHNSNTKIFSTWQAFGLYIN